MGIIKNILDRRLVLYLKVIHQFEQALQIV
jgi:hypothetical protein